MSNKKLKEQIVYICTSVDKELPPEDFTKQYFVRTPDLDLAQAKYWQGKWHVYSMEDGTWDIIENWRKVEYWLKPVPLSSLVENYLKENCTDDAIPAM